MTTEIERERLAAYLDGELDADEVRAIEEALAASPSLRKALREMREADGLLRAAFSKPLREPAPERLVETVSREFSARRDAATGGRGGGASPARYALPIAASLAVLLIGLGSGYFSARFRVESEIARIQALRAEDRSLVEKTVNQVLETKVSGTAVEWRNPDSGSHGTVTPVRTYRSESGKWCREYTLITVTRDGARQSRRAIACREPDGRWKKRAELYLDS